MWDNVCWYGILVACRYEENLCYAFWVLSSIALFYCLLEKRSSVRDDDDGSMGFEVVDGPSNGYGVVVEHDRGVGDEVQMRRIGHGQGSGGLDCRWSYNRSSTLVWWNLSVKVDVGNQW